MLRSRDTPETCIFITLSARNLDEELVYTCIDFQMCTYIHVEHFPLSLSLQYLVSLPQPTRKTNKS